MLERFIIEEIKKRGGSRMVSGRGSSCRFQSPVPSGKTTPRGRRAARARVIIIDYSVPA